ncbi:MAG: vWA domain-containing protein, partial [Pirellulales bacterium]
LAWRAAAAAARQAAQHKRVIQAILDPSQNLAAVRDGDPVIRAAAAWEAVQNDPSPGTIRRALAAAGDPPSDGLEPVEQRFLRMLDPDGDLPATAWSQPPALIQSALHNRARAEQLAAPPDERVHYAVRPLVEAADADRRRAEDNLFVGGADELSEAASQASLAEAAYQQAAGRSARLARAYDVRDRAWWQLPYLAQWLAGRPEPDKTQLAQLAERDRQLATAYEAILANHALAERIERYVDDCLKSPDADNERDEQLDQAALLVERKLDPLLRFLQDRYAEVLRQAKDQRTLREIDALLSVPLVTGIQRRELRDTYREIAARPSGYGEPVGTTKPAAAAAHLQLQRMLRWPQHPALAILDAPVRSGAQPVRSDPTQGAKADRDSAAVDVQAAIDQFARDAQAVRVRLAAANDIVSALASGPASRNRSTPRPARAGLAQADSLVRAAAPLWGTSGIVAADPIAALFRFDLAELLLWQADRALEDFWGPAGGPSGKIPYFAAVAESYRKSARQLNPRDDDAWQRQGQLLARRQRAAREFLVAGTGDTRPVSEAAAIDKDVAVKVAGNLPRGKAALAVYDPAHAPVEVRAKQDKEFQPRFSVPIHGPATNASFALVLRPPGNTGAGPSQDANGPWQLAGLYRGHKSISHFHVLPLGRGLELVHRRQPKPTATVTVLGEAKMPGSLVFVLDCSYSMKKPGQTNGRMNAARRGLINILQRLADVGGYRVSLWLYGHRVAVSGTTYEPVWNPDWPNRVADPLPSDDVEQVASADPLDRASLDDFVELLNKAQPWGRTPLYRSIVDAINNELARQPKEFPRRLIVITDGTDLVHQQGDRWRPREGTLRTEEDVAKAFRDDHRGGEEDRIRLDVVGVAIDDGAAQLKKFIEEDDDIRGRYHPVNDLNLLLNEITKALGLYKFTLREAGPGGGPQFPERSLGESIEVDTREPGRREFDVRLVGADPPVHGGVAIEGGEALQLYLNRELDLWRLVHRRYNRDGEISDECEGNVNPLAQSSSGPFNPRQFYVAAHRPELLAGASVRFPISIQNGTAEEFSPRPAEAWVEIEPVFEPARDGVFAYPIYDLSFEDARSVPVLDC